MDYYSVIKKNGILPFVPTWIDLKGIMLSEMDKTGKDAHCMTVRSLLYMESKNKSKAHKYREQIVGC